MELSGRVVVVTGAANGIGAALARRAAKEGALAIVLADVDVERARGVADEIGDRALAVACDVSRESDIQALVDTTRGRFGPVDVYFSNAGIIGTRGGIDLDNALWTKMWEIHSMAHIWAARAVLPGMLAKNEGCIVITASAAGLLNIVESAPYGVTKHAAVAAAEWLRIAYGRRGIRVSCLCPQSVSTNMSRGDGSSAVNGVLTADRVADDVVAALRDDRFLILPHPEVAGYFALKAQDYERWLGGMQKLHARHAAGSTT